jgi:hypothetical protein
MSPSTPEPRRLTAPAAAALLLLLAGLASPAPARAGEEEPVLWTAGLAVGAGALWTRDCDSSGCAPTRRFARVSGLNLKVGPMVSPRVALLLYVPGGIHLRDGKPRSFEGVEAALQVWLGDGFWLLAGAGLTLDVPVLFTATTGFYFGPGASVAAGLELWRSGRTVLEVQARTMAGWSYLDAGIRRTGVAVDGLVGLAWR